MKIKSFFISLIIFCFSLLLFIAGCSTFTQKKQSLPSEIKDANTQIENFNLAAEEYRISPLDTLDIRVYQEPDLDRIVEVSSEGSISFPLIGTVKVSGLTILEAEKKLEKLLGADYLVNPHVNIKILKYHTRKVIVMGEVKNPGNYSFPEGRDLTVLEAIAMAGGFTEIAAIDRTSVIRIEKGKQVQYRIKISDITKSGDKTKDMILKPNDIIYVPERIF